MPTSIDLAFVVLLFVFVTIVETFVFVPRFRARIAAGVPNARTNAYRRTTIGQWAISILTLGGWAIAGRSWTALGVLPVGGWRLSVAGGFIAMAVAFGIMQMRAVRRIAASPEQRDKHRGAFGKVAFLLPGTPDEYRGFLLLSVTAGICEEMMVRGYLTWVFAAYVGVGAAVVLASIAFGVAHLYQGWTGVLKTGIVGIVMGGIVLASGWLLPAMLLHALIDVTSGMLAYAVLRDGQREALREVLNPTV